VAADALAGLRIVVVEDNEALGEATAALLQSFGADVQHVRDAADALVAIDSGAPIDAVLSDVRMPGPLDGIALGRRLRSRMPPIPVVLTSGYAPQVDADFVFLPKPARDESIVNALRGVVGR
jgi:CheY-like chemotaxis protein